VILLNGMDLNLRRSECKVFGILEIPRNRIREMRTWITHKKTHQFRLFLVLYRDKSCDPSSDSIVYPCYWIRWCVHVIHITHRLHVRLQVRIHTYTRCLSHIRVPTHVRPGTVCQREEYIYLKTVSQLSKFVQSVLFTDIHSITIPFQRITNIDLDIFSFYYLLHYTIFHVIHYLDS